jgi:group I intron endonuclease
MIFILKGSPMIGIYKITNKNNGKSYFGSSKNIETRWLTHKNQLKNGIHHNIHLQRTWDKYGEDIFVFEIVEECDINILLETEQKYLDSNPEYNIGITASGGDNISKNPNKKDIISRITKSVKDRYDSMSDDEKKMKHSKPMEKNPNWKGGSSLKYCECGEKISIVNKTCIKCRDNNGINNPFYGKQHTEESKNKIREKRRGVYNGDQNIPIIIDGVEYRSSGEASKILNIPMVTIRWRVKSKNEKFENYKYKI